MTRQAPPDLAREARARYRRARCRASGNSMAVPVARRLLTRTEAQVATAAAEEDAA